jgi:D-inositol-3-phosphate glycosyltransferase
MLRVAILSLHTSPLAQPGVGDGGGMNVYVRELVSALAHAGIDCTTYTRAQSADAPREIIVEPNHKVVHITAGAVDMPKDNMFDIVPEFTAGVLQHIKDNGGTDVIHANYWLSGLSGHVLKHELNVPLVSTFHTFARVKALGGDPESELREQSEAEVIGCSDAICVSCTEEERQFIDLYGNPPGTIEIVAPGVEHAFFAPGDQRGARKALELGEGPVLLFVGRIQPLKGADVAVKSLAALNRPDAKLLIVGGASGAEGDAELAHVHSLIQLHGLEGQVRFVEPQQHHILSTYYRAADVVLVPSRSESFGLVALEAAACGTPVVANAVGGLLTIVEHGRTGFLVADRQPDVFARHIAQILDDPALAARMSSAAAERARGYTWSFAAARLRRAYADLTSRDRVECQ